MTLRLWKALKKAGAARVVSLSSLGIRFGGVNFEDPNYEHHEYDKWKAYGQSKSANTLFAVGLDKRGYTDGIRVFSVHPGRIKTELARFLTAQERAVDVEYKTAEQGAATSVWCATSPQLEGKGGVYCMDCDIAELIPDFSLQGMGQPTSENGREIEHIGVAAPPDVEEKVAKIIFSNPDVTDIFQMRILQEGRYYHVEGLIELKPGLSLANADDIKFRIKNSLMQDPDIVDFLSKR